MKKSMLLVLCIAIFAAVAVAQNPTYATGSGTVTGGIHGIDKLGAHQNGGRGCVGCHAPHSGARGNGGSYLWNGTAFVSQAVTDKESGDEVLWGQDLGPLYGKSIATGAGGEFDITFGSDFSSTPERISTGVMMCLSCHDGNLAKGAMMTNQSFEQTANLLPAGYGAQPIPTLLGNDGSTAGNYNNDHPIGPKANMGALGGTLYNNFALDANKTKVVAGTLSTAYSQFITNYGSPLILGARTGAGFAVDSTMTDQKQAYVVCTTCHTPHSMYTASAGSTNPIGGVTTGTFPSYFFIAAPYNPGANVADGTHASSATQFCRQCHFQGAGGSNESVGINNVTTAF
ncbi:MAG: hypothetical protein ACM3JB_14070 [Acidobacteriaceae bacterium]